jgi:23S rRNA (adenine2503-C2)-methyltransferase
MKNLLDNNLLELEDILAKFEAPKFRAKQLFTGLHQGKSINEINIPNELKERLLKQNVNETLTLEKEQKSADGTVKYLFKLHDGNMIETVLMKYKYGYSVCVSSQVGCRMNCTFCASGLNGLVRHLSAGEILAQVVYVNKMLGGKLGQDHKVHGIVLMGSGEPLDNYDNVVKFIKLVNDPKGLNISRRYISLSTCGLIKEIKQLADDQLGINLTISLHSATDSVRQGLMPIAKKHNINQVLAACDYYFEQTGRRVIIEYILIKDVTATKEQEKALIALFQGTPYHINLIKMNPVEERGLLPITREESKAFAERLAQAGLSVTLRRTLGDDIDSACGQLRNKHKDD